jgi:hypothetical protein
MPNLLYKSGQLKVADFGLARTYGYPDPSFTPKVCPFMMAGVTNRSPLVTVTITVSLPLYSLYSLSLSPAVPLSSVSHHNRCAH